MLIRETELMDTDPGELVTGVMSGWGGGYHTEKNTLNDKKAIPISAAEIIARIKDLEKIINRDTVNYLVRSLSTHVKDTKNPHSTDLSDFETSVFELIYNEYVERGGKQSYDYFLSRFFEVYRLASLLDVKNGIDDSALITIAVAKKFIEDHDNDVNAHSTLFQRMIPGTPPPYVPTLAMTTMLGFPSNYQSIYPENWTYIGSDGFLHISDSYKLPMDYTFGVPMCPCWETRTNYILNNHSLAHALWTPVSCYIDSENGFSIDNTASGTILRESIDTDIAEHKLVYTFNNLVPNETYTASVYYDYHYGRYLEMRIAHKSVGTLCYARYDCVTNTVESTSSIFNIKVSAEVHPTHTNATRLGITYTAKDYTSVDLEIIPYKNAIYGPKYRGTGQTLGTVCFPQLENGIGMSPVILTKDTPTTRPAVGIRIPTHNSIDVDRGTLAVHYRVPSMHTVETTRTLYSLRSDEARGIRAYYTGGTEFYCDIYDTNSTAIVHYPLPISTIGMDNRYVGVVYTENEHLVGSTGNLPQVLYTVTERYKDTPYLDIGHDNHTNYLNGYVDKVVYYKNACTLLELVFLTGDE